MFYTFVVKFLPTDLLVGLVVVGGGGGGGIEKAWKITTNFSLDTYLQLDVFLDSSEATFHISISCVISL